jgi:hypothetical protein
VDAPRSRRGAHAQGWHEQAAGVLLRRIERKTAFALAALDEQRRPAGARPELVEVVFSESDPVAHHFWRDHDPA